MRIEEEITHSGVIQIEPDTTAFVKSALTWLYWDGDRSEWTWSDEYFPKMRIPHESLEKHKIYYFVLSVSLKCLYFMYIFNIRTNAWSKGWVHNVFQEMLHAEATLGDYTLYPGETHDLYIFDKRGPYLRRVHYPEETYSDKMWRILSIINPFRK